jgi:hypothetical protein
MNIEGRCYCGNVQYKFEGDVALQLQCHCRECQYITGGNPNVIIGVPTSGFEFTKGTTSTYSRPDLDNPVSRHFCSNCGTAIGTESPAAPGLMILKVGTMDDPTFFKPTAAIFTKDSQSFHHIPEGVPSFEGRPG